MNDQPIKDILLKVSAFRRMLKCCIELREFSIRYNARQTIKAKVLADFVVECTFSMEIEGTTPKENSERVSPTLQHIDSATWKLFIDGSLAQG